jgi:hypothetical protein
MVAFFSTVVSYTVATYWTLFSFNSKSSLDCFNRFDKVLRLTAQIFVYFLRVQYQFVIPSHQTLELFHYVGYTVHLCTPSLV